MKIHIFSNFTGMVDKTVVPDFKTAVEIVGSVKTGTLSVGSQNFEIKGGAALVPLSAFKGEQLSVVITAKEGGKLRHWVCGKLKREPSGAYSPEVMDARGALIEARTQCDVIQAQVTSLAAEVKKLKERSSRKLLGGAE